MRVRRSIKTENARSGPSARPSFAIATVFFEFLNVVHLNTLSPFLSEGTEQIAMAERLRGTHAAKKTRRRKQFFIIFFNYNV